MRSPCRHPDRQGVRIEFVKEQLTFTGEDSPMASLLLSVMGAFADDAVSAVMRSSTPWPERTAA
jgi:hypothetical protein